MQRQVLLAIFGLLVACSQREHRAAPAAPPLPASQPAPAPPRAALRFDPSLVRALVIIATGRAPDATTVADVKARLDRGELTMTAYIDQLVATDEFAHTVAPLAILRHFASMTANGVPQGQTLVKSKAGVYYLYDECKPKQAVAVHPYWQLDATVQVCPDSYRPDQWDAIGQKGEPEMACLSEAGPNSTKNPKCGCGPNLIRCYESDAQRSQIVESLRAELRESIAYAVVHDLPIEQIFLANETWRDRNAELIRRTLTIELHRDRDPAPALHDLASWPEAGTWAPREDLAPGQNAGILTAPHLIFFQLDRRQRMTSLYDVLWCAEADSVGATPETLLSIVSPDLQIKGAGWQELAARPICTNCHARLDYGFQFFMGYPNGSLVSYFDPKLQLAGRGPTYLRDIHDPRGETELNPHAFAELAVAQPEFRQCMAKDFAEYTFGPDVTPNATQAVEGVFQPRKTTVRDLMRASLAQYVAAWRPHEPSVAASTASAGKPGDDIAITPELHARLEAACLDCHDADPARIDLSGAKLSRASVVDVLENVAFGTMPKDAPLAVEDRAKFLSAFIAATWSGVDAATARTYYLGRFRALRTYRPELVFHLVDPSPAGKRANDWRQMETSVRANLQQLTPGLATFGALSAIEACRDANADKTAREKCIADAIRLGNLAP